MITLNSQVFKNTQVFDITYSDLKKYELSLCFSRIIQLLQHLEFSKVCIMLNAIEQPRNDKLSHFDKKKKVESLIELKYDPGFRVIGEYWNRY